MLLTVTQLAERLGIGLNGAYALTRRPGFPAVRVSPKVIRIPEAALEAWLLQEAGMTNALAANEGGYDIYDALSISPRP